jgi:hypothetical protein
MGSLIINIDEENEDKVIEYFNENNIEWEVV